MTTARLRARSARSPSKSEGSHDDRTAGEAWLCVPPGRSRVVDPRTGSILRSVSSDQFTARLTIDVTPALRSRIKVVAFRRGLTVVDMLRALLAREFPDEGGTAA